MAAKNAIWIIFGKSVQMILGLLVTILTARYLGPSNYGILNYAIAVVSFVLPIALLGLNSTLVQEIITNPEKEPEIMGSSLVMSFFASCACIGIVAIFVALTKPGETDTLVVCVLYSFTMIAQSAELIQYWFQSKLLSNITAKVELFAYVLISIYKIVLLIRGMSIHWFALSYAFDYGLIAIVLIVIYKVKLEKSFACSLKIGIKLFQKSKYYIISTIMVTFFAQQDKIMINMLIGDKATGIYSAAVTCASMSGFVFVAIIDSMRPLIYESKKNSVVEYENNFIRLYSGIVYLCIVQGIVITLLSYPIIKIIYGLQYLEAVPVLAIFIWYSAFSYIGGIRDIWLLGEDKQHFLLLINFVGVLVNTFLNLIFIHNIGIKGAALASLLTQFITNFVLTFLIKPIRHNNDMILEALKPKYAHFMMKQIFFIVSKKNK